MPVFAMFYFVVFLQLKKEIPLCQRSGTVSCQGRAAPEGLGLDSHRTNILSQRGIENSPLTSSLFEIANTRIHAEPGHE